MRVFALPAAIAALTLAATETAAQTTADNTTQPTSFFYSRPLSEAPALNVTIQDGFTAGYVFIAPYKATHSGPYIYDKYGNLVWDGYGVVGALNAHDFRPCTYKGAAHLCFTNVNQQTGYGIGEAIIVNSDYKVVATVQTGSDSQPADMHEFQLLNDGETAILSSYQIHPYDLSSFNITTGLGWLASGSFQEVNVTTNEVLFEWNSLDHVDPSLTQIAPGATDTGGDGFSPSTAFDYFHINSIDKSSSGNYLVSSRSTATIYYINGTDHTITWRLSYLGPSNFTCSNFNFSFQHDARLHSENDSVTTISLFDNASNGYTTTNPQSSGLLLSLNHTSGVATLLSRTTFPTADGILATSQGNTQVLSNGGTFHSWGNNPYFSEHAADGSAVLLAQFAESGAMNYRAFSAAWESTPASTVPQVYAYSNGTGVETRVYVSWNGATTVSSWRFYGAQSASSDAFTAVGETSREGFETLFVAQTYFPWVVAEAVAENGTALRNSSATAVFVPGTALEGACDADGCAVAESYETASTTSTAASSTTTTTKTSSASCSFRFPSSLRILGASSVSVGLALALVFAFWS